MFKINNKIYENETAEIGFATLYTKKQEIKVIDLIIKYSEEDILKNHVFESIERLEYLRELKIGDEITNNDIGAYLRYNNNDLKEKGFDISYAAEIYDDTDIVVRSKRIDENNISVTISINNKDIDLLCEENINIPLIK